MHGRTTFSGCLGYVPISFAHVGLDIFAHSSSQDHSTCVRLMVDGANVQILSQILNQIEAWLWTGPCQRIYPLWGFPGTGVCLSWCFNCTQVDSIQLIMGSGFTRTNLGVSHCPDRGQIFPLTTQYYGFHCEKPLQLQNTTKWVQRVWILMHSIGNLNITAHIRS